MGAESAATVTGSRFDKLQNNITCASDDLMFIVDADFPVNGNQRFTITKNITLTTNNADYRIYRTGVNASYVTGMFTIQNDGSLMITGSDTHTLRLPAAALRLWTAVSSPTIRHPKEGEGFLCGERGQMCVPDFLCEVFVQVFGKAG